MALIKLELARSEIKRYLENLNKASDSKSEFQPLSCTKSLNAATAPSKAYRTLDLSHAYLNDDEFITLLPELAKLTLVTELNLEENRLTGLSVAKIREFLPNLETLNISNNRLSKNEGCHELSKFTRLRRLDVINTGLKSEDLEKLEDSNSLLKVSYEENPKVDIVRKARLEAACDYNNRVRIQKGVCTAPMSESKDDYIRNNITKFAKTITEREKQSAWLRNILNTPTHHYVPSPEIFEGLKIK